MGGACVGACVLSMRSGYLGRKEKRGEVRQSEVLCVRSCVADDIMWLMRRLKGKSGVEQVALLQQTDGDSYRALTHMMLNL